MTRADIQKKHGVYRLEPPDILNAELTSTEAEQYEKMIIISKESFKKYWDEDFSGDID